MKQINYDDMPAKFRFMFIKKQKNILEEQFVNMGFKTLPETWQYKEHCDLVIYDSVFYAENGNYYSAKLDKIQIDGNI